MMGYKDCWNCKKAGPQPRREITLPDGSSRYPYICEPCWQEHFTKPEAAP